MKKLSLLLLLAILSNSNIYSQKCEHYFMVLKIEGMKEGEYITFLVKDNKARQLCFENTNSCKDGDRYKILLNCEEKCDIQLTYTHLNSKKIEIEKKILNYTLTHDKDKVGCFYGERTIKVNTSTEPIPENSSSDKEGNQKPTNTKPITINYKGENYNEKEILSLLEGGEKCFVEKNGLQKSNDSLTNELEYKSQQADILTGKYNSMCNKVSLDSSKFNKLSKGIEEIIKATMNPKIEQKSKNIEAQMIYIENFDEIFDGISFYFVKTDITTGYVTAKAKMIVSKNNKYFTAILLSDKNVKLDIILSYDGVESSLFTMYIN